MIPYESHPESSPHPPRIGMKMECDYGIWNASQSVDSVLYGIEFEHNLSQQIYLSDEAWNLAVNAKSATVGMINNWAQDIDPDAPAFDLSKHILNKVMAMENFPTKGAIRYLKGEIRANF